MQLEPGDVACTEQVRAELSSLPQRVQYEKSPLLPTNQIFMKLTETWYFWLVNQLL